MDYRNLGRCGVKVSPVCLGTMMFGGQTSEADSIRIIHKAHDLGVNFIDTANMYNAGESERVVGKAIADRRDSIVLATKGRQKMGDGPNQQGGSRKHLMAEFDASLKRLGTDYVDIYYYHAPDFSTPIDETLRALDDMVKSGRAHYIACSNFRAWRICEALWTSDRLNLNRYVCIQPLYNIVNRDIEVEILPLCEEYGLGVVSYSPLARGILTGKYTKFGEYPEGSRASRDDVRMRQAELRPESIEISQKLVAHCQQKGCNPSQFALAWVLANPILTSVIIGPRTIEQFEDNMGCLDVEITDDDEAFVDSLVPPGEHSGFGFQDEVYPITGRGR
ncbi:MAG: aldo/keto reductase [Planctomycetota bacterium]|nr:MAG: aldo/keto reductase [Planctomycetota bacterium]REJ98474.1 MAG: aldo/keto reductase [Planctomycetota bacterium]REK23611.1 MAG: aldo/keto reductase [Planctomycetota bacterium]REK31162.1 MAG: aldo/keto reductase [Planctomycetota bacterium]